MPPKENPERACEECIHFFACSRQCGEPMAQSSATGCECYETVKSIAAARLIERLTAENVILPDGQASAIETLRKEIEWKDMVIALAQKEQAEAEAERDALREKQRWIPVTERLPDERDAVIILLKDGQVFRGEIRERIALPEWWYFYDASDTDMDMLGVMYPLFDDGLWLHENPVVAWMPLPEALEEALEEGEKA